jgi:small basic protein
MRTKGLAAMLVATWIVAIAALAYHGWYAVTSQSHANATGVAGVWVGQAQDGVHGVFYRPLLDDAGYGGSRYFPLFFAAIAALMRAGVPAMAAGFAVSLASVAPLFIGLLRLFAALGTSRATSATCALLAIAPHFVQETATAIRSDVLAVALVVWGLAAVARLADPRTTVRAGAIIGAAVWLTLAFATKPTAIYGAGAAFVALAAVRRMADGWRVLLLTALGCGAVLVFMQLGSRGRWFEAFQVSALAGSSWHAVVGSVPEVVRVILAASRLFTLTLAVATAAALVTLRRSGRTIPVIWMVISAPATALVLATPGAVGTNHGIDVYVAAVVVLGTIRFTSAQWGRIAHAGLAVLLMIAAGQNAARVARLDLPASGARLSLERQQLTALVFENAAPVLSELPQLVVAANRMPEVIDPFSLRVVSMAKPAVLDDLRAKLARRHYSRILLLEDPATVAGRGWYMHVHFGWPVIEAVLESYRYSGSIGVVRIYVPKVQ